jgi:hypothetical protein
VTTSEPRCRGEQQFGGTEELASAGTIGGVSQVEPVVSEDAVELDVEDRSWLDERLREYRELLAYLHDH